MNKLYYFALFSTMCLISSCSKPTPQKVENVEHQSQTKLGNLTLCQQYSGLPSEWLKNPNAGMQHIQGGTFQIGNNNSYPEEKALYNSERKVQDFWIDQTEVTNAQFQSFIQATAYVTEAEMQGEGAVFKQPKQQVTELAWWSLDKGANWKHPWGSDSTREILPNEPVRMITLKDAIAYADWLGRDLPTEEQWEYAAKGFSKNRDIGADLEHINANVWQGEFPYKNENKDHFIDIASVGCFEANGYGLYDMIGNVWEYTNSPFKGTHDDHMGIQQLHDHQKTAFNSYTIKGGSYLCAANYCMRYRASARHPQESNLGISHVGFRTIKIIN